MRRGILLLPALAAGFLVVVGGPAGSEREVAPPVAVQPQPVIGPTPAAQPPFRMLAEDAQRLLEHARLSAIAKPASPGEAEEQKKDAAVVGVSRTIEVEPPLIVHHAPWFEFRDVTGRAQSDGMKLTDEQRRRLVEAYRQSLSRRGGAR